MANNEAKKANAVIKKIGSHNKQKIKTIQNGTKNVKIPKTVATPLPPRNCKKSE